MILVDTSVWIEGFRRAGSHEAEHLRILLDADEVAMTPPVRIEILSGSSRADFPQLCRTLSALPLFTPSVETWERIESWVERAVRVGRHFGVADLQVAAVAAENELPIWSLDRDFAAMAKLGFIRVHNA